MRATRQPVRLVAPDQEHAIARAASLHGKPLRGRETRQDWHRLVARVHVARQRSGQNIEQVAPRPPRAAE